MAFVRDLPRSALAAAGVPDRPTFSELEVAANMGALIPKPEILEPIIRGIAVDVVDDFGRLEVASKIRLNQGTVVIDERTIPTADPPATLSHIAVEGFDWTVLSQGGAASRAESLSCPIGAALRLLLFEDHAALLAAFPHTEKTAYAASS